VPLSINPTCCQPCCGCCDIVGLISGVKFTIVFPAGPGNFSYSCDCSGQSDEYDSPVSAILPCAADGTAGDVWPFYIPCVDGPDDPTGHITWNWTISEEYFPGESESCCILWVVVECAESDHAESYSARLRCDAPLGAYTLVGTGQWRSHCQQPHTIFAEVY
jgi:hypothetical protein